MSPSISVLLNLPDAQVEEFFQNFRQSATEFSVGDGENVYVFSASNDPLHLDPATRTSMDDVMGSSSSYQRRSAVFLYRGEGIQLLIPDSLNGGRRLDGVQYFRESPQGSSPSTILIKLSDSFVLVRSNESEIISDLEGRRYRQGATDGDFIIMTGPDLKLVVNLPTGEKIPISFHRDDTVEIVMDVLFRKTRIPKYSQKLLHDGHELEAGKSLEDNGLKDGDILQLIYTFGGISSRVPRAQTFRSDVDTGNDLLGVEAQLWALADAISLKELEPPFAVGILGPWGSGKSFAMNLIKKRLGKIMEIDVTGNVDQASFPYVGHIYIVEFSAWTYAKKNLWSSLMFRILTDLNDQLSMEELLRRKKDLILKGFDVMKLMELSSGEREYLEEYLKRHDADEIREKVEKWNKKNGEATGALVKALQHEFKDDVRSLPRKRNQLERLNQEIKTTTACNPIRKPLETAKKTLTSSIAEIFGDELVKYRKANPDGNDIQQMLQNIGLLRRYAKLVLGGASYRLIGITVVGISICFVIPIVLDFFAALFLPVFPLLLGAWKAVSNAMKKLDELGVTGAIEKYDDIIFKATEEGGTGRLESLLQQKDELENEIKLTEKRVWLVRGDSLLEAVQKRLESSSYEAELGVVHQAHLDLLQLSETMTSRKLNSNSSPGVSVREESPVEDRAEIDVIFPRGRPRIVLFIDDLDRCPPDQVVQVLEALQLLVKTKLFVVVVSMDMRYVTRALEIKYNGVLHHSFEPSGLEYVQKIIQLPYQLPNIDPARMRSFLNDQMQVSVSPESAPRNRSGEITLGKTDEGSSGNGDKNPVKQMGDEGKKSTKRETKNYLVSSDALHFTSEDLDLIEEACTLAMVNPRTVRRLVNVFKIMKIVWAPDNEPDTIIKGKLLLLLAFSSSCPRLMNDVLRKMERKLIEIQSDRKVAESSSGRTVYQPLNERLDVFMEECLENIKGDPRSEIFSEKPLWGDVKLSQFELGNVRLLRSFSFFGDCSDVMADAQWQNEKQVDRAQFASYGTPGKHPQAALKPAAASKLEPVF